jgi:DNA-binding CsgD family transcriptional regulator
VSDLTPLVGRGPELAVVTEALASSGRAVVVIGEAGVGKTRLLSEAVKAVENQGVVVVVGRCLPLSAELPLLPILDLLRHLSDIDSGRLWTQVLAGLPPSARGDVGALLPDAEEASQPKNPIRRGGPLQQARLFDALRQTFDAAGRHRVAVAVEDIHWADEATRDLLEYLLGSSNTPPISLVLSCRSDESMNPGTGDWVDRLPRLSTLTFVRLAPLDDVDSVLHLRNLAGEDVDRLDIDELVRRSQGNAFFLEQLAGAILQREMDGDPHGLPKGLQSLLAGRIDHVDGLAKEVLSCLAICADASSEELLVECTALSTQDVRRALRELSSRHLLRAGSGRGELRLAHALLEEAVVARLLPGERRDWHKRVASALEPQAGMAGAGAVAEHYRLADQPADELRWRVLAAEHADRLWASLQSAAHWQRAIALNEGQRGHPLAGGWTEPKMYLAAARSTLFTGNAARAAELAETALELYGSETEVRTRAALLGAVGAYRLYSDHRSAIDALRQAVSLYETVEPDIDYLRAAYMLVGGELTSAERRKEAAAVNARALAAARTLDAPDELLELTMQHAYIRLSEGDEDAALATVAMAGRLLGVNPNPHRLGIYVAWRTTILLSTGRAAEVPRLSEQAGRMFRRPGPGAKVPSLASAICANLCRAYIDLGDVDSAIPLVEMLTQDAPTRDSWMAHASRSWVDMLRGDTAASQERWRQLPPTGTSDEAFDVEPARMELDLWLRRPGSALAHALSLLNAHGDEADTRLAGRLLVTAAWACADLSEQRAAYDDDETHLANGQAQALRVLHRAMAEDPFATGPLRPTAEADALIWEAEWTRAAGASDPATWAAAAEAYARYPRPHRAAYARWRQAQGLLVAERKTDGLAAVLRIAAREARGHEPLLGEIRRLAERARVSLDTFDDDVEPTAKGRFGLTPRELVILQRVARGDTNRQIGRELFISEKTASVHVSNILRKLQVTNRLQAAAVAERSGLLAADGGGQDTGDRKVSSTG